MSKYVGLVCVDRHKGNRIVCVTDYKLGGPRELPTVSVVPWSLENGRDVTQQYDIVGWGSTLFGGRLDSHLSRLVSLTRIIQIELHRNAYLYLDTMKSGLYFIEAIDPGDPSVGLWASSHIFDENVFDAHPKEDFSVAARAIIHLVEFAQERVKFLKAHGYECVFDPESMRYQVVGRAGSQQIHTVEQFFTLTDLAESLV